MMRTATALVVLIGLLAGNAAAARSLKQGCGGKTATGAPMAAMTTMSTPMAAAAAPMAAAPMAAAPMAASTAAAVPKPAKAAKPVTLTSALAGAPPAQFSTLLAAVKAAGLAEALDKPDLAFTIFAPTNEAFTKLIAALKTTPAKLLANKPLLTKVLSYHVVPAVAQSKSLKNGEKLATLLKDQGLTVELAKSGAVTIQGATNSAKVVAADVPAGKSVVHVIDAVLVPK